MDWINVYGVCVLITLLLPNIIYGIRNKGMTSSYQNKIVELLEQIGRFGTMAFLAITPPFIDWGFPSNEVFAVWLIGVIALMAFYWLSWLAYFVGKEIFIVKMLLAILPVIIFVGSGIMMRHYILLGFSILFGVCHIFISYKNAKATDCNDAENNV